MNATPDRTAQPVSLTAEATAALVIEALGTVESTVPGRVRVRLKPELRTPEAIAAIQGQLDRHEHVGDVSINPRTGSVVVTHAKHRRAEAIFMEAFQESELLAAAVLDLPDDDEDEGGGGRFGKLDQQLADVVYRIDAAVYRKTGLRFRGQILAGSIAGVGIAQIVLFGISLETLPGPLLLWVAWDVYHRVAKEPPLPDAASDASPQPDTSEPQGEAVAAAIQ